MLVDRSVLLGLGDEVDVQGAIPDEARHALIESLSNYADLAARSGAEHLTFIGTEPLRRARNGGAVAGAVLATVGSPLHVLSHEQEAMLTLLGVTGGRSPVKPLVVVDIGGGSTEVIIAAPDVDPVVGILATGSARLTASLVENDPPTWFEINALRAEARRLVSVLPEGAGLHGVMVGGTASNLVRLIASPPPSRLQSWDFDVLFDLLARTPSPDLVATYPINRRRAGQLCAGAALADALMERYRLEATEISSASLREGAILARAMAGNAWLERLPDLCRPNPNRRVSSAVPVEPLT